jgi:hypothetical protein
MRVFGVIQKHSPTKTKGLTLMSQIQGDGEYGEGAEVPNIFFILSLYIPKSIFYTN